MTRDFDRIQVLRMQIQQDEVRLENTCFASTANALRARIEKNAATLKKLEREYDQRN